MQCTLAVGGLSSATQCTMRGACVHGHGERSTGCSCVPRADCSGQGWHRAGFKYLQPRDPWLDPSGLELHIISQHLWELFALVLLSSGSTGCQSLAHV